VRVAALYDVHGNLPALEAVLRDVQAEEVDVILFGGDLAAGAFPRGTIELARSLPEARFVRGNADRLASPATNAEADAARRWVETQLDSEQIAWLAGLPFSAVLDETLYVHATPQDDETVVTELTTEERFAEVLAGVEQQRVVAGHTHMQLERRVGETLFVNPGSVGMPYEAQPGAYWALLDEDGLKFRRSDYDLEAAAALVRDSGHPLGTVLADENVLRVPSRAEALAVFGG
jgi:putative phosphoesterase